MKKLMKINQNITGEYTFEEIVEMYKPYIKQESFKCYKTLKSFGEEHSLYIELEDIEQIANMHLLKAYKKYDINYKTEKENCEDDDSIGFFAILEAHVSNGLKRIYRDSLKIRRKDYNLLEIKIASLDESVKNNKEDGKEITLSEILDIKDIDYYEKIETKMEIEEFLSTLSSQARKIIELTFFENKTQNEIAKIFNISQVQVSRILKKSLKIMNNHHLKNKSKENRLMSKTVIVNYDHLLDYLKKAVDTEKSLNSAVTSYCNENNITLEDAYNTLERRKASYNLIKSLYDNKKAERRVYKKEELICRKPVNVAPKEVVLDNVSEDTPSPIVKEKSVITCEEKPKENLLKDINILSLKADINGLSVNFSPDGIDLCNVDLVGLKVEDLIKLQQNIQKVIDINNTLYK